MCCGCITPKEPPTQSCASHVKNITILMWCSLGFGILKLLSGDASCFADFIGCFILYYAYVKISYCTCIIYIFFQMLNIFSCFLLFGKRIQNKGTLFYTKSQNKNLIIVSLILSCIFYLCTIYVSFLAYREFKATDYDEFVKEQQKFSEEQEYIQISQRPENGYQQQFPQKGYMQPQYQPYPYYQNNQPLQYEAQNQQLIQNQNRQPQQYGSFEHPSYAFKQQQDQMQQRKN